MTIYKTPTPEEINEAAQDYSGFNKYSLTDTAHVKWQAFKDAISWLQNYQTQQQGAVMSAEEEIAQLEASLPNYPTEQSKHAIRLRINTYKDCLNILKGYKKK